MKISCPDCEREYPVPITAKPDTPFKCKCGFKSTLGAVKDYKRATVTCPECERSFPVPPKASPNAPFKCKCGHQTTLGTLLGATEEAPPSQLPMVGAILGILLVVAALIFWVSGPPKGPVDPTVEWELEGGLAAIDALAQKMIDEKRFLRALDLYLDLSPFVRDKYKTELLERENRLLTLAGEKALDFAGLPDDPDEADQAGRWLFNWVKGVELLNQRDLPIKQKIKDRLAELKRRANARPEATPTPTPKPVEERKEPPERIQYFERMAAKGRERVDELRRRIKREKAELTRKLRAEVDRARRTSEKRPLNVELVKGFSLERAVIQDFDEYSFRLRSGANEVSYPWEAVQAKTALRIRRMAVRGDEAEDFLRFGFWCLKQRMFLASREAFQKAVRLDRKLAAKVPDVREIEKAARVFTGEFSRTGSSVTVAYEFDRPEEGRDWLPTGVGEATPLVRDGRLEVHGQEMFLLALREVGFDGHADISALMGPTTSEEMAVCFGIGFAVGTPEQLLYLVTVSTATLDLTLYRHYQGQLALLETKRKGIRGKRPRLRLQIRDDTLKVLARGQTQISRKIRATWENTHIFVGGIGAGQAGVSMESITIRGRVRQAWLRKSFQELEAMLFGALRRTDELPVFVRRGRRPKIPRLSAEDAFGLDGVSPVLLSEYDGARKRIYSDKIVDLEEAIITLERVLDRSQVPFAAAHFRRAEAQMKLGRHVEARGDLEQAITLCPRFFEAMAVRSEMLSEIGQPREAVKLAEEAVAIRPDYPGAYRARGMAYLMTDRLRESLADFEVARALDPWNDELVDFVRNVSNVIRGPPWSRTFRVETKHYVLRSNISERRARDYADHLEAVRAHYVKAFARNDMRDLPAKAQVLIFDTQEGYHSYSELSINDRVESTLGVYLPKYRQLCLFEDKEDVDGKETRYVLSHEGFHQFMHQLVPDNAIPYWLNEGLAEYFAACDVQDGRVISHGGLLPLRVRDLFIFMEQNGGQPMSFPVIMQESPGEFYSGVVWAKYAQAWSMVHFFRLGANADTKRRFLEYVNMLRDGVPSPQAFAKAWGNAPWASIQENWLRHVQKMVR